LAGALDLGSGLGLVEGDAQTLQAGADGCRTAGEEPGDGGDAATQLLELLADVVVGDLFECGLARHFLLLRRLPRRLLR
jgi:hypothetical protein